MYYCDAYIYLRGTITVLNTAAAATHRNNTDEKVIFKSCAPFTDWIREIVNTQVDSTKNIDVVMPKYNLIEYGDICSKTSGS